MSRACGHLDQVADVTPSSDGCEDCLRIGGRWVHLRMCMTCGHVGCCDNSPNRHATAHFRSPAAPAHPVLRTGRGLVVLLRRRPRLRRRRRTVVRPPMSAGPANALRDADTRAPQIARSAVVIGTARLGEGSLLAEGAVIRSHGAAVEIGTGSAVLENSVVVGTRTIPTSIGRRTTFGHRCLVIGATVGDLCEIGNASMLMPGARLGDRVFLGEGTAGAGGDDACRVTSSPSAARPASSAPRRPTTSPASSPCATATCRSRRRPPSPSNTSRRRIAMGQLYDYRGIVPTIAASATLFPTAEITGDVVVGERTIIGAGVKIIGDSHGPVRIGNDVQILENTVLHLLPDNDLIIDDGVIIGPGAMIHGCRIGARSIVEPGAIVCDGSVVGAGCVVRAGAVVKQRSHFASRHRHRRLPRRRHRTPPRAAADPHLGARP